MNEVRRLLAVLFVLVLGAGVVACGSDSDSDGDSGGSEIEGINWNLMNVATQGAASSLPKGVDPPTVEFSDGKVDVFAGCNSGSGEAEIGDTTIEFGPIALTRKSCGQVENQVEFLVTRAMRSEANYEVNADGLLVLENGSTSLVFTPEQSG